MNNSSTKIQIATEKGNIAKLRLQVQIYSWNTHAIEAPKVDGILGIQVSFHGRLESAPLIASIYHDPSPRTSQQKETET